MEKKYIRDCILFLCIKKIIQEFGFFPFILFFFQSESNEHVNICQWVGLSMSKIKWNQIEFINYITI